jgi:hypothetical protein
MAGRLPIRKIYVDSKFKTKDSKSDSHFKYELTENISIPDNVVMYLDNIVIPNSWLTIDETNNRLYFMFNQLSPQTFYQDFLEVKPNNYSAQSLRDELQEKFNEKLNAKDGTLTITYNPGVLIYALKASENHIIKIYTDEELNAILKGESNWTGITTFSELRSINDILTNTIPNQDNEIFTGLIDLRRYSNLYITSSNLSSYSVLGSNGQSNILKKVPVNVDYGSIIYDNINANHDWCNVSKMLLKTIEFRITDDYGNDIDLRGKSVSWSMIFIETIY